MAAANPNQTQINKVSQAGSPDKPVSESFANKITGGISWWFSAMMGKPKKKPQQPNTAGSTTTAGQSTNTQGQVNTQTASTQINQTVKPKAPSSEMSEDSILQDIVKLKGLLGKFSGQVSKKVAPMTAKAGGGIQQKGSQTVGKIVNTGALKKILTVFFVLVVIMVLAFLATKLFKNSPSGEQSGEEVTSEPTATSAPFIPYKPSVYADDIEIIKLDEEISTLEREFASSDIKETQLSIPNLDFDISF